MLWSVVQLESVLVQKAGFPFSWSGWILELPQTQGKVGAPLPPPRGEAGPKVARASFLLGGDGNGVWWWLWLPQVLFLTCCP